MRCLTVELPAGSACGLTRFVDCETLLPTAPGRGERAFPELSPKLRRLRGRAASSWSASLSRTRSVKSLLEPRVVAYCSEVVVCSRLLAEWREQLA